MSRTQRFLLVTFIGNEFYFTRHMDTPLGAVSLILSFVLSVSFVLAD